MKPYETDTARKLARTLGKISSLKDLHKLEAAIKKRISVVYKKERLAEADEAWERFQKEEIGSDWMLGPGWVSHSYLVPGRKYRLVQIYKGRKHIGAFFDAIIDGERNGKSIWVRKYTLKDLVPYDEESAPDPERSERFQRRLAATINRAFGG